MITFVNEVTGGIKPCNSVKGHDGYSYEGSISVVRDNAEIAKVSALLYAKSGSEYRVVHSYWLDKSQTDWIQIPFDIKVDDINIVAQTDRIEIRESNGYTIIVLKSLNSYVKGNQFWGDNIDEEKISIFLQKNSNLKNFGQDFETEILREFEKGGIISKRQSFFLTEVPVKGFLWLFYLKSKIDHSPVVVKNGHELREVTFSGGGKILVSKEKLACLALKHANRSGIINYQMESGERLIAWPFPEYEICFPEDSLWEKEEMSWIDLKKINRWDDRKAIFENERFVIFEVFQPRVGRYVGFSLEAGYFWEKGGCEFSPGDNRHFLSSKGKEHFLYNGFGAETIEECLEIISLQPGGIPGIHDIIQKIMLKEGIDISQVLLGPIRQTCYEKLITSLTGPIMDEWEGGEKIIYLLFPERIQKISIGHRPIEEIEGDNLPVGAVEIKIYSDRAVAITVNFYEFSDKSRELMKERIEIEKTLFFQLFPRTYRQSNHDGVSFKRENNKAQVILGDDLIGTMRTGECPDDDLRDWIWDKTQNPVSIVEGVQTLFVWFFDPIKRAWLGWEFWCKNPNFWILKNDPNKPDHIFDGETPPSDEKDIQGDPCFDGVTEKEFFLLLSSVCRTGKGRKNVRSLAMEIAKRSGSSFSAIPTPYGWGWEYITNSGRQLIWLPNELSKDGTVFTRGMRRSKNLLSIVNSVLATYTSQKKNEPNWLSSALENRVEAGGKEFFVIFRRNNKKLKELQKLFF